MKNMNYGGNLGYENTPQLYKKDSPNKKKWNWNQATNAQNHSPT